MTLAVSWALEFHFTIRAKGGEAQGDDTGAGARTQVLMWRVPVVVAPRTPPATVPWAKTSAAQGSGDSRPVDGAGPAAVEAEAVREAAAALAMHASVAMAKHMRAAAAREAVLRS